MIGLLPEPTCWILDLPIKIWWKWPMKKWANFHRVRPSIKLSFISGLRCLFYYPNVTPFVPSCSLSTRDVSVFEKLQLDLWRVAVVQRSVVGKSRKQPLCQSSLEPRPTIWLLVADRLRTLLRLRLRPRLRREQLSCLEKILQLVCRRRRRQSNRPCFRPDQSLRVSS